MNKKLGNDPLKDLTWIDSESEKDSSKNNKEESLRITFLLKKSLIEKMKDFAYWERLTQSEIINHLLEEFLKNKKIRKRSDKNKKLK